MTQTTHQPIMDIDPCDFRKIFERMPYPAFFHDHEFRLMLANDAYFKEAGVDAGQAIGKFYWEVLPKGNGPMACCKAAFQSNTEPSSFEEVIVDNKIFLSFSYINRDSTGKSIHAIHILTDVTERNHSIERLSSINEQFSILFQLSTDAIMLLDVDHFIDCNPSTLRMFGCKSRDDFIGKQPSQFSPEFQYDGESSASLAKKQIATAFANGNNFFAWRHQRLDGTVFDAEVLLIAFKRKDKVVIQATVRDITDRKLKEQELIKTTESLQKSLKAIIATMNKTMELRDPYTAGHQNRVARIATEIAIELGWDKSRIEGLEMAALIHDIGKIGVPSEILSKPSRLSVFEQKLMQEHPAHGYEILKDINFPWPVAEIILQHHERLDGSGYPNALTGDSICPEARIIAVADTIEAMSSHRPYRPALGLPAAIHEISLQSGNQLDPTVVAAAIRLYKDKKSLEHCEHPA